MKQKPTFKSILLVASLFSLFAFAFVNVHAGLSVGRSFVQPELVQTQLSEDEQAEEREVAVPDVTILGRLWEISQKILDRKN